MVQSHYELGTDGPRTIVVGVDMSRSSLRAGAYAAGLARRQNSQLVIVYAQWIHPGSSAFDPAGTAYPALMATLDANSDGLRDLLSRYPWSTDARLDVRPGHPAQALAETADATNAGAIVVGCSRRVTDFLPQTAVSVQLIRRKRWPVIVVP